MNEAMPFQEMALGVIATQSFPAIVGIADAMLKAAAVRLLGFEMVGAGQCAAVVRGRTADVALAVEQGTQVAGQFEQRVAARVISRPSPNLEWIMPIGVRLLEKARGNPNSQLKGLAVGLLETRGFPAMVGAADVMLKTAEVYLADYEKIGDGLCTAIIRGSIANVAVAIEAGMQEAEKIGQLNAVMVIPKPLDDLEGVLPVANCWSEQKIDIPISFNTHNEQQHQVLVTDLNNLKEDLEVIPQSEND